MIDQRLREALSEAAEAVVTRTVRPLVVPSRRTAPRIPRLVVAPALLIIVGVVAAFLFVRLTPAATVATGGVSLRDLGVSVFLCKEDSPFPKCKGHEEVTTRDRLKIERTLKALPMVRSVQFQTQQQAYETFRAVLSEGGRVSPEDQPLYDVVKPEDMPESFRVEIKPGGDHQAVVRAVQDLPGVANVVDEFCSLNKEPC